MTSRDSSTRYYTSKSDAYWKSWVEANRVWFRSEADLLAAFPGRIRRSS
ncbi:MAG TPA: hypothetical protein VFC93_11405 [Chloroflexota bacterium]|nr:hypothetical protein [Chloroflexota bacterium]